MTLDASWFRTSDDAPSADPRRGRRLRGRRAVAALCALPLLAAGAVPGVAAAEPTAPDPLTLLLDAVPLPAAEGGNSSLGGTPTPPGPVDPGGTANYLTGARNGYIANLDRVANAQSNAQVKSQIQALKQVPVADWVGGDGVARVTELTNLGATGNAVPVIALYHIPDRDLGGHSGGGAANPAAYKTWIDQVAAATGTKRAVFVVEPDALAQMQDLPDPAKRDQRADLLAYAVTKLSANPNATVYLDAGTPGWRSVADTVSALNKVKAKGATIGGISLNVSNFKSEADSRQYAQQIAQAYGSPLKVLIDNSRNGGTTNGDWCNPSGQRLGTLADRTFDPSAPVETVFIKTPGESDGNCGISSKPAGQFDDALLLHQLGH